MFTSDSHGALALAHHHVRHFHAEAAAERLRDSSRRRRVLAASLRRAADRLDPAALVRRPASQV